MRITSYNYEEKKHMSVRLVCGSHESKKYGTVKGERKRDADVAWRIKRRWKYGKPKCTFWLQQCERMLSGERLRGRYKGIGRLVEWRRAWSSHKTKYEYMGIWWRWGGGGVRGWKGIRRGGICDGRKERVRFPGCWGWMDQSCKKMSRENRSDR